MLSRILIIAFFLTGCGNNVQLKANKLEKIAPLSAEELAKYEKNGVLIKGTPNRMQYQGQNLEISKYSSKMTSDFIASVPQGSQIPVVFTGGTNGNQVVVETIKRR